MYSLPGARPTTEAPITLQSRPITTQHPPVVSDQDTERHEFEHGNLPPHVLLHQWSLLNEVPPESLISPRYISTRDTQARSITLKEAVYLSLKNNPGIEAAQLDPVASLETVRQAEAVFDPDFRASLDEEKFVTPTTSVLQSGGATAFVQKFYDWNFSVAKVLRATNGTFGISFNNQRSFTNSIFSAVNPSTSPALTLSLAQPLLRNFGWDFATINVRIAEFNQKQSQFNYEQQLNDFVLRVVSDYWNVVRAEENLQVARDALKLAQDLVRQNEISVRVGVLAPISIREAQSEEATREAGVYSAEDQLTTSRALLRQDVMVNPSQVFIPAPVEPIDRPNTTVAKSEEEQSLELAMEYRPELASMREAIRSLLLQVKAAENQTLPQFNVSSQFGLSATAGFARCSATNFGSSSTAINNCLTAAAAPPTPPAMFNGNKLPFGGIYGDALNRLWSFSFYNYAILLNIETPIDNDAAKAALAQTKIEYEQERLRYRDAISQIVVDVQRSLADLEADVQIARATAVATEFAAESLRAEEEKYKVGMATTHELLQFQDTLVSARGNQVQAEVNLEIAKAAMRHAQGVLLQSFNVVFVPENPNVKPWYAHF
jgi:outer membrane protein TolC